MLSAKLFNAYLASEQYSFDSLECWAAECQDSIVTHAYKGINRIQTALDLS